MAHSDCGWTCGCVGKTVRSLENTCHTWALLWWWFTMKRHYIKCMHRYCYPTLAFHISNDLHHRLRRYCWETARRSIRPNFSVHPVGKTMHWIKKWMTPPSSITMQSLGKISQCTPAVGAKMWCLFFFFFFFFLSLSESGALCVRGLHSSNKHSN